MARQAVPTVLTGDAWTAAQHNTYIKDNEAAHWPYTTAGDMPYATASNALARLAIGAQGTFLRSTGSAPAWFAKGTAGQLLRINSGATDIEWASLLSQSAARVTRVATQTIPNAVTTFISFTAEVLDTGGYFVIGSPTILTIPVTGFYLVVGFATFNFNTAGERIINIQSGGSVLSESSGMALLTNAMSLSTVAMIGFTAGDTVNLGVYQNTGGNLNVTAKMSIIFLGP